MLYTAPVSYILIYDTAKLSAHRAPIDTNSNALYCHGPQLSGNTTLSQIGSLVAEISSKKGLSSIADRGTQHKSTCNSAPRAPIDTNLNALCSHGPQLSVNTILSPIGSLVAEILPKEGAPQPCRGVSTTFPVVTARTSSGKAHRYVG